MIMLAKTTASPEELKLQREREEIRERLRQKDEELKRLKESMKYIRFDNKKKQWVVELPCGDATTKTKKFQAFIGTDYKTAKQINKVITKALNSYGIDKELV